MMYSYNVSGNICIHIMYSYNVSGNLGYKTPSELYFSLSRSCALQNNRVNWDLY